MRAAHATLALTLAIALAAIAFPALAGAAFDVRDASPAALGAASLDIAASPFFETGGLAASASHASLYQAEGLTSERATVAFGGRATRASATWNQLGFPGAREHALRLEVQETGPRALLLSVVAERLALAIDGEPSRGGFAVGASILARVTLPRGSVECVLAGDRIARTPGLYDFGVEPSVPFTLRLRSGAVALAWMDRWEASGRTSPRLVLDLALGRAARVRMARGVKPGRSGAAIALRRGRIEVSAGRLDQDAGGSIGSVALALVSPDRETREDRP
jgi:hypothetical protein